MARSIVLLGIGLLALGCDASSPDSPADDSAGDDLMCARHRYQCDAGRFNGSDSGGLDAGTDTGATHSVVLTWTASVTAGVTYRVHRSDGCTGTYAVHASGLVTTSFTDSSVTSGQKYCYVTTAVDADGESVDSNSAQAIVP
jgi:hypothetical protein